jgi:hypothetical protein
MSRIRRASRRWLKALAPLPRPDAQARCRRARRADAAVFFIKPAPVAALQAQRTARGCALK